MNAPAQPASAEAHTFAISFISRAGMGPLFAVWTKSPSTYHSIEALLHPYGALDMAGRDDLPRARLRRGKVGLYGVRAP